MIGSVHLQVDGCDVVVPSGANVAAAVARVRGGFGRSPDGRRREPVCGMGVCFECTVTINAVPHQRACMILARNGMQVRTHV